MQIENISKGNSAYVQVTSDEGVSRWLPFRTHIAASEAVAAIELGIEDRETITLAEFFDRFMSYHAIPNLKRDTVQRYCAQFESQIRSQMGDMQLVDITPFEIDNLRDRLVIEGQSKRRIDAAKDVLSTVLGIAAKWQYIEANPADKLDW